jgi:hypothetical protein
LGAFLANSRQLRITWGAGGSLEKWMGLEVLLCNIDFSRSDILCKAQ